MAYTTNTQRAPASVITSPSSAERILLAHATYINTTTAKHNVSVFSSSHTQREITEAPNTVNTKHTEYSPTARQRCFLKASRAKSRQIKAHPVTNAVKRTIKPPSPGGGGLADFVKSSLSLAIVTPVFTLKAIATSLFPSSLSFFLPSRRQSVTVARGISQTKDRREPRHNKAMRGTPPLSATTTSLPSLRCTLVPPRHGKKAMA